MSSQPKQLDRYACWQPVTTHCYQHYADPPAVMPPEATCLTCVHHWLGTDALNSDVTSRRLKDNCASRRWWVFTDEKLGGAAAIAAWQNTPEGLDFTARYEAISAECRRVNYRMLVYVHGPMGRRPKEEAA